MSGLATVSPIPELLSSTTKAGARATIDAASIVELNDLRDQVNHTPIVVSNLQVSIPIFEFGATAGDVTFTWDRVGTATSQTLNPGSVSISPSATSYIRSLGITSTTTYTLTVSDGTTFPGSTSQASVDVKFQHKFYWGGNDKPSGITSADILAFGNAAFGTGKARDFTITVTDDYPYFGYLDSYGDLNSLSISGFNVDLNTSVTKSTVSFQNVSGGVANFLIYRLNDKQTGTFAFKTT